MQWSSPTLLRGSKTWDLAAKQYDINTNAAWTANGNDITVTNHSNNAVTASFTFAPLATYNTITGSFSKTSFSLEAADKETVTAAELIGTTAFAANPIVSLSSGSNSDSHDVMAKYTGGATTPDVYSVDVAWGAMEFTYNVGGTNDWNPADHSYTNNSTASWSASGNTVIVTNHSNRAVTAVFAFVKDSGVTENITGTFDVTSEQLDAGTVGGYATADSVTSTLTVGGVLDPAKTTLSKVGTIIITIQ